MDDQEYFKMVQEDGDAGIVRHITYTPLPRGKHTFTIVSTKRDAQPDTSKFLEVIAKITDDSPENGMTFKIRQMLITKDQKVILQGKALAAGLWAACKKAGATLSSTFTGAEGVVGVGWLDIEVSGRGEVQYTNQALYWGEEEPPVQVPKARGAASAAKKEDDPPF